MYSMKWLVFLPPIINPIPLDILRIRAKTMPEKGRVAKFCTTLREIGLREVAFIKVSYPF